MSNLKRFSVHRERTADGETVRLSGALQKGVDLAGLLVGLPTDVPVIVSCRDVTFVDSLGAKAWMEAFGRAAKEGVRFSLAECPPPVVERLNMHGQFACGARVISVAVPFNCADCGAEFQGVTKTENLRKIHYRLPAIRCGKCGKKAEFPEAPEEYFAFLMQQERNLAAE